MISKVVVAVAFTVEHDEDDPIEHLAAKAVKDALSISSYSVGWPVGKLTLVAVTADRV